MIAPKATSVPVIVELSIVSWNFPVSNSSPSHDTIVLLLISCDLTSSETTITGETFNSSVISAISVRGSTITDVKSVKYSYGISFVKYVLNLN